MQKGFSASPMEGACRCKDENDSRLSLISDFLNRSVHEKRLAFELDGLLITVKIRHTSRFSGSSLAANSIEHQ
jgi:hypothetical protein